MDGLFREQALNARSENGFGTAILIRPPGIRLFVAVALSSITCITALTVMGGYTQRSTVAGEIVPDTGVIQIHAPQPGVVVQKTVTEGQAVKKGEILYILSSEYNTSDLNNVRKSINQHVSRRLQLLRDELKYSKHLQRKDTEVVKTKLQVLSTEKVNIDNQIQLQLKRLKLTETAFVRTRELFAEGFLSAEMLQQKEMTLLDQKNSLQVLERDRLKIELELAAYTVELQNLPIHNDKESAQILRALTEVEEQWTENEGKRTIAILAPSNGIATAPAAQLGQSVDGAKRMVSLIPLNSSMEAHLYAPSRAIGFVKPGDTVYLRYQAYPYQKFGHAEGIVSSVSRTAISINEAAEIKHTSSVNEPLYRIVVALKTQTINAYGKTQRLEAGLRLEADIQLERRKLYEWVLEPLYSITGKL